MVSQQNLERPGINKKEYEKIEDASQTQFIYVGSEDIVIDVIDGHGYKERKITKPKRVNGHKVRGMLIDPTPNNGAWDIIVKNIDYKEIYTAKDVKKDEKWRKTEYTKEKDEDIIRVDVTWSEKGNTTFKAHIEY